MTASPRTWALGAAVAAVLLALASWFLVLAPQRAEASGLQEQAAGVRETNAALSAQVEQLRLQYARLPEAAAELAALQAALPPQLALAELTRDLDATALSTGITVMSVTAALPKPVAAAPGTDPAAPAPASTDPAAPVPAQGAAGVVQSEVAIQVVGSLPGCQAFLRTLQASERNYLVTGLSITAETGSEADAGKPATANGDVTMGITGQVFVLPDALQATAAAPAVPAAPVPADPAQTADATAGAVATS